MEIRNWKTGEVIYQAKANIMIELVEKAVKEGVSLGLADLNSRDFRGANFRGADLSGANFSDADLNGASLRGANLRGANLRYANLSGADLRDANLSGTDLHFANLSCANLEGADLSGAYFYRTYFAYANFRGANLEGADLSYAYLSCAKNMPDNLPMACPKEGSFIAWKKVNGKLVKLEIPEDAKRSSATSNKCRCSKAKVLAITDLDGTNPIKEVVNYNFIRTITLYKVGKMVYPDSFDDNRWDECSHGIHFFMDKQDAIDY